MDKLSVKTVDGKTVWHSDYMTGTLVRSGDSYTVTWDGAVDVTTGHNEAGRGAELSELVRFNGHLYSFDDRCAKWFFFDVVVASWTFGHLAHTQATGF